MMKAQSDSLLVLVANTLSSKNAAAVTIGKNVQPSTLWPGARALSGSQNVPTVGPPVGGPPGSGCAVARRPVGCMFGAVLVGDGDEAGNWSTPGDWANALCAAATNRT